MGLNLAYRGGQTPLDDEEKEGLLISTVSTRAELDEFEQQNIEEAMLWAIGRTLKPETIFTEKFIRKLHRLMYGSVWAGEFRRTDKNLGVDKWQIPVALKMLNEDALYWVKNEIYSPEEIALRFKHRIVSIHCFPNGNGRHSRLMADIIIEKVFKRLLFSWGAGNLIPPGGTREDYLKAIRAADNGTYDLLFAFARS